jgi:hypothetical protein
MMASSSGGLTTSKTKKACCGFTPYEASTLVVLVYTPYSPLRVRARASVGIQAGLGGGRGVASAKTQPKEIREGHIEQSKSESAKPDANSWKMQKKIRRTSHHSRHGWIRRNRWDRDRNDVRSLLEKATRRRGSSTDSRCLSSLKRRAPIPRLHRNNSSLCLGPTDFSFSLTVWEH